AVVTLNSNRHHRLAIQRREAGSRLYGYRHEPGRCRVVAERTVGIVAPSSHGAVGAQRQTVRYTARNGYDRLAVKCRSRPRVDSHRRIAVRLGAVSKLAAGVITPSCHSAIRA